MPKPTAEDLAKSHRRYCDCTPIWEEGEFGRQLVCGHERSLIWWPTPDTDTLSQEQDHALFIGLAMFYDADGETVGNTLLKLGYSTVTPANFDEAYRAVRRQFEHELWQDNLGKQLLGRLLDDDLAGDGL